VAVAVPVAVAVAVAVADGAVAPGQVESSGAVMLSIVLLASGLLSPIGGQRVTARTGAAAAVFNANTYLIGFGGDGGYFDVGANVNALLHTWSLSVEELFYLVFPAMLVVAWLLGRRLPLVGGRLAIGISLVAISVLSFLLSWALSTGRTGFLGTDALQANFAFYSAPPVPGSSRSGVCWRSSGHGSRVSEGLRRR
jgi:peptidoglycan/LPS O-acetylase OafA/YrhL